MNKLFISAETKGAIDEQNRTILSVVGSSGIIDRQGESLDPKGWVLDNYIKNPVVLYAHDYKSLPVGKAEKVWLQDGQLLFNIKFADTAFANEVFELFKQGMLNAFSVGFIPLDFGSEGEFTFTKQELLELSVVPVPANPEALRQLKDTAPIMYKMYEQKEKPKERDVIEPTPPVESEPEVSQKAGRVLSKKNEDKISQAVNLLSEVLSSLEKEDLEAGKQIEPEKKEEPITNDFLFKLREGLRKQDKETGLLLKDINSYLHSANTHKKSLEKGGEIVFTK